MSTLTYLNFDIQIDRTGDTYRVQAESPTGETVKSSFEPPFSAIELENFLLRAGPSRRGVRRIDSQEVEAAKQYGQRMYSSIFTADVRGALQSSLDEARRRSETGRGRVGVRIRLRLTGAPELANIPWEYIYNSGLNRFLSLSVETPLVRYLELPERIRPIKVTPPIRIMVVIAGPRDYPQLDVQQEWEKLQAALTDLTRDGLVELDLLEIPTLAALQRQLRRGDYHVLHFIGHGGYDHRTQDGLLVLEDEDHKGRMVSGQDLGMLLHDHTSLRLAILNACEGARTGNDDPFAGVAQSLVQQGIPAVIAMQFEITDTAAITFAHEFYRAISDDYPVDAALAEARKVMFAEARGNGLEWGTPVLYMRSPDGRVFDVQKRRASSETRSRTGIRDQGPGISTSQPELQNPKSEIPIAPPIEAAAPVSAPLPAPDPVMEPVARPVEEAPEATVRGMAAEAAPTIAASTPAVAVAPPVPATPAPAAAAAGSKSSPMLLIAGVILVLLLAAGGSFFLFNQTPSDTGSTPSAVSTSEPPSDEALAHFEAGMDAFNNRELQTALDELTAAIDLKPDYAEAYVWRAMTHMDIGDSVDAVFDDLDKAIEIKPDYAEAYYLRGMEYVYTNEPESAFPEFEKALEYKDEYLEVYRQRGELYLNDDEWDKALDDFNRALEIEPADNSSYWGRGLAHYHKQEYEDALEDFTRAIELYDQYVEAFAGRADTYRDMGDKEKAIADYRKVIEYGQTETWKFYAEDQLKALGVEP